MRSNAGFVDTTGWAGGEDVGDFTEGGWTGRRSDSSRLGEHREELKLRGGTSPRGSARRRLEQRAGG